MTHSRPRPATGLGAISRDRRSVWSRLGKSSAPPGVDGVERGPESASGTPIRIWNRQKPGRHRTGATVAVLALRDEVQVDVGRQPSAGQTIIDRRRTLTASDRRESAGGALTQEGSLAAGHSAANNAETSAVPSVTPQKRPMPPRFAALRTDHLPSGIRMAHNPGSPHSSRTRASRHPTVDGSARSGTAFVLGYITPLSSIM